MASPVKPDTVFTFGITKPGFAGLVAVLCVWMGVDGIYDSHTFEAPKSYIDEQQTMLINIGNFWIPLFFIVIGSFILGMVCYRTIIRKKLLKHE